MQLRKPKTNKMEFNEKQLKLVEFVSMKHGTQTRKYTGERYVNHPVEVAKLVGMFEPTFVEVALCHDLYEDTTCDFDELHRALVSFGYDRRLAYSICTFVTGLTDIYTHNDFPYFNRKRRKELEAIRLGKCGYVVQTVKCADLVSNSISIVEFDEKFSKVYLSEKEFILSQFKNANPDILFMAEDVLRRAKGKIN